MDSKDQTGLQLRLLNEHEVAEFLGVTAGWCQKARVRGGGPPFMKLGKKVRYSTDALQKWVDSHQHFTSTSQVASL